MAAYVAHAPTLAVAASQKALAEAGVVAGDITHVVSVSCTGFMAPGIDMALIEGLGLKPTVERTHIGFMGCHGAINGLKVARGSLSVEPEARVLVCAVEMCTLHYFTSGTPKRSWPTPCFLTAQGRWSAKTTFPMRGAWPPSERCGSPIRPPR